MTASIDLKLQITRDPDEALRLLRLVKMAQLRGLSESEFELASSIVGQHIPRERVN